MLECVVQIRFTNYSLGNRKTEEEGKFEFVKNPEGRILFPAAWHFANMRFAAEVLGRYHREVQRILWDPVVDGNLREDPWYRLYREVQGVRSRYTVHEAFFINDVVNINVTLPSGMATDDLMRLMVQAGKFKGLSPYKPGQYGHFSVVSVTRRLPAGIDL